MFSKILNSMGVSQWQSGNYGIAEYLFRKSARLNSDANSLSNLGALLMERNSFDEGFGFLVRATQVEPDNVGAIVNLANAYHRGGRTDVALGLYHDALRLNPGCIEASLNLMRSSLEVCEWNEVAALVKAIRDRCLSHGDDAWGLVTPFTSFFLPFSNAEQKDIAEYFVRGNYPKTNSQNPSRFGRVGAGKIKIAYLSSDFHDHPTAHLSLALYAGHDRSHFEVYAYSVGYPDDGFHRKRIVADCDVFRQVDQLSDSQIAKIVRSDGIDILIDLKGYTGGGRPGVMARKPAPVQINYLGYPGTMGAHFIDYIIADPLLIPADHFSDYSEHVLWMPDSYQPTDAHQVIGVCAGGRERYGLPSDAFVYCCFNNSAKIDGDTFVAWMDILRRVDGSVLWLLEAPQLAKNNMQARMRTLGVDPERLKFAPVVSKDEHLARVKLADLALDTFIYNAHTTATDALFAGVPMVTKMGGTFASRVGASVVSACGLHDLVTITDEAYVDVAVRMAQDGGLRFAVTDIMNARLSSRLFDTKTYVHHLDDLLLRVWAAHQAGVMASAR